MSDDKKKVVTKKKVAAKPAAPKGKVDYAKTGQPVWNGGSQEDFDAYRAANKKWSAAQQKLSFTRADAEAGKPQLGETIAEKAQREEKEKS